MLKKYSRIFRILFVLCDAIFISLSWITALLLSIPGRENNFWGYTCNVILFLPVFLSIFYWHGLYRPMRLAKGEEEVFEIVKAVSLSLLLVLAGLYFMGKPYLPELAFVYFWLLCVTVVVFSRIVIRTILKQLRKKGFNLRHILIVGAGELGRRVAENIGGHPELGLNIVGFVSTQDSEAGKSIQGIPVLGEYKDLTQIAKRRAVDQIIFALPMKEENVLQALSEMVGEETADIKIALEPNKIFPFKKGSDELNDLVIVDTKKSPLYGWKSICKRILDVIVSLSMLISFSPLLLFIALIIKCTSRGPVLYRQKRISLNETSFELTKFRTMVANAENPSCPMWTNNADKRRTWIGKILRRFSLDEFPQFLNVLRGEMSVVGPRPERQVFAEQFSRRIPKYILRHTIKPGMTGWAQVHGWRGDTSIDKRVEYDLYYIENWSLWLDIKIILLTIPAIIRGGGAY